MEGTLGFYQNNGPRYRTYEFNDTCEHVEVTDIPISEASGMTAVKTTTLHSSELENWLLRRKPRSAQESPSQFRIVWIPLEKESISQISERNLSLILKHFHIERIFDYTFTSHAGFANSRVGPQTDLTHCYSIFLNEIGDFRFAWLYNAGTGSTQGVCLANPWIISSIQSILGYQSPLLRHPMALAYSIAILLSQWVDTNVMGEDAIISEVENRTCLPPWRSTLNKAAKGDFSELSARMSGCSISLALSQQMTKLVREILKLAANFSNNNDGQTPESCNAHRQLAEELAQECHSVLRSRSDMQEPQLDYLLQRAQIQLTALFNLIAQQNAQINITLAKDSRTLASASKRDSSSMKTLAAVTVAFLPATFVASLFALPLFDWDAEAASGVVKGRFWVYCAVAAPLTITTLVIWLGWTRRQALISRAEDRRERNHVVDEVSRGQKYGGGGGDDRWESGDVG